MRIDMTQSKLGKTLFTKINRLLLVISRQVLVLDEKLCYSMLYRIIKSQDIAITRNYPGIKFVLFDQIEPRKYFIFSSLYTFQTKHKDNFNIINPFALLKTENIREGVKSPYFTWNKLSISDFMFRKVALLGLEY